jgi:hypothetical protein
MNLMVLPRDTGNSYKFRASEGLACLQINSDDDEDEDPLKFA